MTHNIYTQQQLRCKSLPQLKQTYSEIGCTTTVNDRRCKDSWRSAIASYQESKLQKVDEQDIAQGEFNGYIADQAQAVAPEELTVREISFYEHEIYCGTQLIASITYDCADFVTQPWIVTVAGVEKFRANTWARCQRYIQWHHKNGTLNEEFLAPPSQATQPEQSEPEETCTTGNEIMAQIFDACEQHGLELLEDGIYKQDVKLGQAGCTNGNWWFTSASQVKPEKVFCDSVKDAVWLLQIPDELPTANEYLQYHPLEQLSSRELQGLFEARALLAV
ncbi:hypothetical protein [Aulosira sp. FACHB-615]|uniref:hypothetical protein n=1 Tax=Aulosira sp. FACHB-615 TaxID=2692777 RepID=UPI00168376F5|nr:hypothetical protein [Aulosira sp. FACHB-615]MBD2492447.1 hypothetical protein [Aulosira sp. FACHB-615]